ncbi:MAG: hypothetical protein KJ065_26430 [Anaerolineae bacterium]|nr:hypothetical protein [Anaerolineae bacterium]
MKRILLIAIILMLALAGSVAAQDATAPDVPPALEAQMLGLEDITEAIRGLDAETPVDHAFPTRAEVREYIADQYREQLSPELARRALAFYVALELLPPETDLTSLFIEVLGSQVAGFYDTETGVMNVIPVIGDDPGEGLSLTEQIIYVHEYTHALQDQHFALDSLIEAGGIADHPDQLLAALSLVEGDASLAMNFYTQQVAAANPLAALSILIEGVRAGNLLPPGDIPQPLLRELIFPYDTGLSFAMALFSEGNGWDLINKTFDNPPTTSEQIIHPEKYLAGESAIPVDLSPVGDVLGDDWEMVWDTALGEFYLAEYLRTQLDRREALAASAGWGGDHMQIFVDDADRLAWVLKLVWDTPQDAVEFAQTYADFATERGGETGSVDVTDTTTCYTTTTTICVNFDSSIISAAPDLSLARDLLHTQMN